MDITLDNIPVISNSLKYGSTQSMKLLYKILGFADYDRNSRKKIRAFSKFSDDFDFEKHKNILLNDLSLSDFVSVANILHLEITGEKEDLCDKILIALRNLTDFQTSLDTSFLSDTDDTDIHSPSLLQTTDNSRHSENNHIIDNQTSRFPPPPSATNSSVEYHSLSHPHIRSVTNGTVSDVSNQIQGVNNHFSPPPPPPPSLNNNVAYPLVNQTHVHETNVTAGHISDVSNQFWFLLRDLSGSCRNFSGNDLYSITRFFSDIEENFQLFPTISDQQKLIFAKRLIVGPAKTFLFSQRNLNSYDAFKNALITEFSDKVTSIEIHKQLENRRMRHNETFMQYFIAMREIANRAAIPVDESSVIQYTIQGIQGTPSEKFILSGSKSYSEFKEKLRAYENIMKSTQSKSTTPPNPRYTHEPQRRNTGYKPSNQQQRESKFRVPASDKPQLRCFNCNEINHISKFCPHRTKGPKCLSCNSFGHLSKDCRRPTPNESFAPHEGVNTVQVQSPSTNMSKKVLILDNIFIGLVDTGSHLTLLKHSAWIKIGAPPLANITKTLTGFGFSRTKIIGTFDAAITIDEQIFSANISVVPNNSMHFDLILGCDVIKQANLTITPDGVEFEKFPTPNDMLPNDTFIMAISPDSHTFDIGPNVSPRVRAEIEKLLLAYKPCKTKTANVELDITLTDDKPIFLPPRRLPFTERDIVDKQVDEWLRDGIIEPCSSPYASPVVVVRKKDGKPRVCVDYRQLNRKLVKDRYPLPLIEDILDCLQNAKIFSTFDLRNGFFHVPVNEKSRPYTSFVTNKAQFQFRYMPFGLSKCPSVFMRYINAVFRDLIARGILLPYLDDLIIPANNESEALERLNIVLEVARDYGLDINFKKCQFLHSKIEFLGHIIENGKLSPSPSKTKAVLNFPDPKNTKDVQRFLGLSGYFRKFIHHYSTIARPLSDLLRKNTPFRFEAEQQAAFQQLKRLLSQQPVLQIFNQKSPTEIHTDASIDGLGAVLLQKSLADNQFHPVYYASRKTSDSERKYTSYELEVLAIVEALKKFRIYVLGTEFKIVTDCDAFVKTMNKKELNSRIARWALFLQDFDYKIEHRTGSQMAHVDALSRHPCCLLIQDSVHMQLLKAQQTDEHIAALKTLLQNTPHDNYIVKNNLLYKTVNGIDLLVVPETMQNTIIKAAHERGHFAVLRTQEILNKEFFIPNMKEKIERYIANCVTCILNNRKRGKQDGLLHPIEKDDLPLHTYHIDHLGPLATTSKRYKHILSVIDSFTKFVWLYPTKSTDAAEVINRLESQRTVFGNPARIISDKGPAFTSTAFKEYCVQQNIAHAPVTAGLPRANGQVERLNSTIIAVLSKLSADTPEKWYTHVAAVQQILNSTFQRSIKTTPFELLFGTKMKSAHDMKIVDLINDEITATFVQHRDDLRKDAKQQISKVQDENRRTYNLRRKQAQKFSLNDLVAIKRTQFGPGLKLKQKFLGPYKITKVKNNDTYDVEKCEFVDGPLKTSTCAEYMKPWSNSMNI